MSTKKLLLQITGLALAIWLLAGCGSTQPALTAIPTPIPAPTTAVTVSATETTLVGKGLSATPPPAISGTANAAQPQTKPQVTRIQFQANATSWQSTSQLAPNTSIRFVLSALKGQVMTVELTTQPDSGAGPSASVYIWGADSRVYTPELTTKYKGILTASQD